jgi:hypothetical protein
MSKPENLTPERMKCAAMASCPSLHRLEDGRLLVVGVDVHAARGLGDHRLDQAYGTLIHQDAIGIDEAVVAIPAALLDTYVEEKVREAEAEALAAIEAVMWQRDYAAERAGLSTKDLNRAWNTRALSPSTQGDA